MELERGLIKEVKSNKATRLEHMWMWLDAA